jgi:hypothetical protein
VECLLSEKTASSQKAISATADPQKQLFSDSVSAPSVHDSEARVGSAIASLWIKVNQENQPPASIPSTLLPSESCPQCHCSLVPLLQPLEQQVCAECGWSSQPHNPIQKQATPDVADSELFHLLEQAASESLENMKPRKKRS